MEKKRIIERARKVLKERTRMCEIKRKNKKLAFETVYIYIYVCSRMYYHKI